MSTDQLNGNHEDCLERELATANIKQILQTLTQQLQHQGVVPTARSEIKHLRHTVWDNTWQTPSELPLHGTSNSRSQWLVIIHHPASVAASEKWTI